MYYVVYLERVCVRGNMPALLVESELEPTTSVTMINTNEENKLIYQ